MIQRTGHDRETDAKEWAVGMRACGWAISWHCIGVGFFQPSFLITARHRSDKPHWNLRKDTVASIKAMRRRIGATSLAMTDFRS